MLGITTHWQCLFRRNPWLSLYSAVLWHFPSTKLEVFVWASEGEKHEVWRVVLTDLGARCERRQKKWKIICAECVAEAARNANAIFLETGNAEKLLSLQIECKSLLRLALKFL